MNEKIALLASKVSDPKTGLLDRQKFAELIIQECITVTKNVENGYSDYRNQIEDGMREAIISNIEHHFGVNNEPKV